MADNMMRTMTFETEEVGATPKGWTATLTGKVRFEHATRNKKRIRAA
jgi:hypothetical protein